jgi:pyridoxine 4-dehydrogenase
MLANGTISPLSRMYIQLFAGLLTNEIRYSPIGRGMLSGHITKPEDIPEGDFRKTMPRFNGQNFKKNLELVRELEKIAKKKGCTPAQLAINWVKGLSKKDGNPEIIPIPGASSSQRVGENTKDVSLSKDDVAQIESVLESFTVAGGRYGGHAAEHIEG